MEDTAEDKQVLPKSTDRRKRKAFYYHLGEKDHPTIIDGLRHYASLYHIALKIGCGYSSLKKYIHEHEELLKVQKDAKASIDEFVESQIIRKCASGYFPALAFYAERKMGWTPHQTIENVNNLPMISFGLIQESQIPEVRGDAEVKQIEAEYLEGDKKAAEDRADRSVVSDGGSRDDLYDDVNGSGDDQDVAEAEFIGISGDEPFGSGIF